MMNDPELKAAVHRAALKWCGEKDRETSLGDIWFFEDNWRFLPGLKRYVDAEIAAAKAPPHDESRYLPDVDDETREAILKRDRSGW